ncbi:uncharacterized protein LOC133194581 [Saccostrea echinata]|uniref:uncharacterized protein LOC133194581 n=1 Tax=Saccostrea echinata TaxID=191078 RepID=UPI002A80FEFE|nr:uncharacterized protein LOC133194581 [Saccostrea echinata]
MSSEISLNILSESSIDPPVYENVDSTESAPSSESTHASESNHVSESGYGTDKGIAKRELSTSQIMLSDATFQIFLSNFIKYHNPSSLQSNNNGRFLIRRIMRRKIAIIVLVCLVLAFIISCVLILALTRTKIRHVGNLPKNKNTSIWSDIDPRDLFLNDNDSIKKPEADMTLGQFIKMATEFNNTLQKNALS